MLLAGIGSSVTSRECKRLPLRPSIKLCTGYLNPRLHLMSDIAKQLLARGSEGEDALLKLMDHRNAVVRMKAAAACLDLSRDRAVNVLADICDLRAGKVSMDAMHALLFAGEFDMKTGPKRRPV
ncbi:MAG: DUF2019 domain-containing protein [Alphaproteobacteria bacterium]|nr:DUF2019 domain-containing protein [Alphaproteobacteria bacterium]